MKAKILKKEYYVARTTDGKEYPVDINNSIINEAFIDHEVIDGDIITDEVQDRYDDGSFSRSYTVIEKFVPKNKNK